MEKIRCPLPKDCSFRLVSSCLVALTGGSLVLYCWRWKKDADAKRQVAKATADRKSRVRRQKDSIKTKNRIIDDNLQERIVSLSSEELLKEIAEKRLTVLQVLQAYKVQSFQADLSTNCITEYLEDAEEVAKSLDAHEKKGPLHGMPISIKETYSIKGLDCTAGLAHLLNTSRPKDATIVACLKQLGAVLFARTNIVQTTCSFSSSNPIYGMTVNPHNAERIPGGSSSGEGALVGAGGSMVGFGTDVGGSVRIPAAMCGHYSLKPTQKRLSGEGIKPSLPGIVGLHDCPGIMSREMQVMITVFKALVSSSSMSDMDPRAVPLPFQEKLFNSTQPLTIGYYEDDGIVGPTPGCRRAVRVAKSILEIKGHKMVAFTLPNVTKAYELTMTFVAVDGGQTLDEDLRREAEVEQCMAYARKGFFHRLKELLTGKKYLTILSETVTEKSAYELWQLLAEREDYLDLFIESIKRQKIDAILAPGYAMPACSSDFVNTAGGSVFITMMYNMLNFPAGAVPVTRETQGDQQALDSYPTKTALQHNIKEATKGATGMPLGVQIVGLPWQEELVLRIMKELDEGIKKRFIPDEPTPPIMDILV